KFCILSECVSNIWGTCQRGIGTAILQHLAKQALDIREKMPLRFLFVDALPHAVQFYVKNGFIDSNIKRGRERDLSLLYIDLNRVLPKLG
ncbi:MAG: GNAT family N-acetyltransferase, partial [Patescibacteria group bacterium]